jgi:spore coat protein U-like protein
MNRNPFSALVVAAFIASICLPAAASPPGHTLTSTEHLTATVVASCNITANGALNFPDYMPAGAPANSQNADLAHTYDAGSADASMQCTANTTYHVTVASTSGTMTGVAHGGTLPYTYNVLGTFSTHPTGGGHFSCPVSPSPNIATGTTDAAADPVNIEFAGCINPGLWPTPDHYTDVFTFTVSF